MKNNQKRKRLQPLLLVLTALLLVLSACSSGGSDGEGNNAPANGNGNGNTAAEGTNANADADKPELKRLSVWQGEDYNTYPVAALLEEKTGYPVKYDMLPQDKWQEKLNLLLGSGEPYDAVTIYADKALYSDFAQKGALVDLMPLIEEYGPNIQAALTPEMMEAVKVNDKLYAIPDAVTYKVNSSILIRTDWLEQVGLEKPTTLEELTAALQAFKEQDPGGNGNKNVPLTIHGNQPMLENIVGAFGMPNAWNEVDGELLPRILDPSYADYVTYVSDLYEQGLLDSEFVANKDATAKEKFSSGQAGAIIVHWADIPALAETLAQTHPDAAFEFIGALTGPSGEAGFSANSGFDRLTFIPKSSNHPEEAIKWINATLEEETFKSLAIGEEGTHYKVEDGAYVPIQPIFTDERNLANNYMSGVTEHYPQYWQARVRKNPVMYEAFSFLNNEQPEEIQITNVLGLSPFMPTYSKNNQQLETMVGDYTIKLIAGAESLDGLEEFRAKYNAAGGEASVNEVNEWYANR
ncbi:extracellular solute-binding protein [Paenibacillus sp. IB182496]|uniref:Extracellular solute-binding protein n=1 Tax=Paenibacillus sabuli TaxID=2772509 RepID=A0A927BSS1_9BACL|nr:extracellular solute-binding protein [Paenibacillus sabuli]MBD2844864.1 extracellular solute-binding protein [Paenibacillus sabuli]